MKQVDLSDIQTSHLLNQSEDLFYYSKYTFYGFYLWIGSAAIMGTIQNVFLIKNGTASPLPDFRAPLLMIIGVFLFLLTGLVCFFIDRKRKLVSILYLFPQETGKELESAFMETKKALKSSSKLWYQENETRVDNVKYHGGVNSIITKKNTKITRRLPIHLKANLIPLALYAGKLRIYFMPDGILLFDRQNHKFSTIPENDFSMEISHIRFIETGALADDARIMDKTWQYVNKKGGPDLRFRENPEIPVVLYTKILIRLANHTSLTMIASNPDSLDSIKSAFDRLLETLSAQSVNIKKIGDIQNEKSV